jgi:enoyl-CoA hydratase
MDHPSLLVSEKDGIATVAVNRPDRLNALDRRLLDELTAFFEEAAEKDGLRAVVLTGAGERAFAAGADIEELAALDAPGAKALSQKGQRLCDLIEAHPLPVLAAVNGFALGGGCELALACDLRFAAETARFGLPEVTLGIIPGYGGTQRLARIVGRGRALEMILTGAMIDAQEALRIGLANRVFPRETLLAETEAVARKIAANAPMAVRFAKEAVRRGLDGALAEGQAVEAGLFGVVAGTADMREGLRAFLEKRKPRFAGT